jgi:glycosyltransferase involved in cell wall biosynthesis
MSESAVKISVLTPSYNYREFLHDTIESVARQDGAVEHVIMDGQSTDGTPDLLAGYGGSFVWRSEPDSGQSDAMNKAFALATGDIIGWLNADEFYLPDTLSRVHKAFEEQPDVDVFFGDFIEIGGDGEFQRLLPEHRFSRTVLEGRCFIPSCTFFARRSSFPARLLDDECRSMMDWDLFLEMCRSGARFGYIPYPLAAFRIHAGQVTAAADAQSPEEFAILRGRHQLATSELGWRVQRLRATAIHAYLKARAGGYRKQRVAGKRLAGRSLRWFDSSNEAAAVTELLDSVYR